MGVIVIPKIKIKKQSIQKLKKKKKKRERRENRGDEERGGVEIDTRKKRELMRKN